MKFIYKLIYVFSPIPLIVLITLNSPSKYANLNFLLPMLFGIFSYTWLLWQFILSARPKALEKYFGLDKIYRFHGVIALVALFTLFLHKTLIERLFGETIMSQLGSVAFAIFIGISGLSLLFMSPKLLKKFKPIQELIKKIRRFNFASYQFTKSIHNFTIVALVLMQIHVLMTTSAQTNPYIFTLYMVYFFLATGFYLYHKLIKAWLLEDTKYKITNLVYETEDMMTISLTPQNNHHFQYSPGQFAYFKISSPYFSSEEHPFSIVSSPTEKDQIAITVKAVGDYTKDLRRLKIGDEMTVEGPFGKFSFTTYANENASVFIAGGIGITPFISMLEYMAKKDPTRPVMLLWSVRKKKDLIKYDHLVALKNTMPNFIFVPIVSGDETWEGESGRLDYSRLEDFTSFYPFRETNTGYYICGPENLMTLTLETLLKLRISKNQIHYESFSV